jgi:hypothetical protein
VKVDSRPGIALAFTGMRSVSSMHDPSTRIAATHHAQYMHETPHRSEAEDNLVEWSARIQPSFPPLHLAPKRLDDDRDTIPNPTRSASHPVRRVGPKVVIMNGVPHATRLVRRMNLHPSDNDDDDDGDMCGLENGIQSHWDA